MPRKPGRASWESQHWRAWTVTSSLHARCGPWLYPRPASGATGSFASTATPTGTSLAVLVGPDGSTNVLPVGDEAAVRRGWELHARDLHPAQLPTRLAATYA